MRLKHFLPVILFFFIAACSLQNRVKLLATNAKEEVPSLGNLNFSFDKNLVGDTLINFWDSTQYITFEPPISGRFRWENAYELVFSPDAPLAPATNYTAHITNEVVKHSKWSLASMPKIQFHTPNLRLDNVNPHWELLDENTQTPVAAVELYFSYPVDPQQLKEHLTIEVEGEKKNFSVSKSTADAQQSIRILDVKAQDKNVKIKVEITPGLVAQGGKNGTQEKLKMETVLTSPFELSITDLQSEHSGVDGAIHVFTSQEIMAEGLEKKISISPKVEFQVQVEKEGFTISSEHFDVTKQYSLVLASGLKGRIGGVLKSDYTNTITFGQLEPSITFLSQKGIYLTSKGDKNIALQIINVPKIKVSIYKVYENNLKFALNNSFSGMGEYEGSNEEGESTSAIVETSEVTDELQAGDLIYEKEIETQSLPKYKGARIFKFDFQDKLAEFKGIYKLVVRSSKQYYLSETKLISLSDIGMIAKLSNDKLVVFNNSIKTTEGLAGVQLTLVGANNQTIGSGVSNASGVAEITLNKKNFTGFRPSILVAKMGADFNYLPLASTQVETSRFDVGGKEMNSVGMDVFVYSERDMYRPGETMNFSVIARMLDWARPAAIPLKIRCLLPNGKEYKVLKKTLNEEGSLEGKIDLGMGAITGSYSLQIFNTNEVLLQTKNFLVEEFMPDKIKLTTTLDKTVLKPGDNFNIQVLGTNFFGPPAAGRNYEIETQINEKVFNPKKFPNFNFQLSGRAGNIEKGEFAGQLDEAGSVVKTLTIPTSYSNMGLLEMNVFTTVFDESGRPVNRKATAQIYTQEVFYGIAEDGYGYFGAGQNISFGLIALNKQEIPVSSTAHIQIIKHDYRTNLVRNGEYFRYESTVDDRTVVDKNIILNGANSVYNFLPKESGDYEIRIAAAGSNSFVKRSFYCYGWNNTNPTSFEVNNEGNVDISTDKESYFSGDKAKILFKTPFNGKLLVTVENNQVLSHFYIQTENRSATLDLPISGTHLPNIYIAATLIKPHEETDLPLTVAHGFQSVLVSEPNRKMKVTILSPTQVRSNSHQKITVQAAPNAHITLAAVDEGILQMTGFQTPDPYNFFYEKRALNVKSFDLYPLLFPEIRNRVSSTGGDGFDLSKRVNPMQNKRVKLLTYWSGIQTTNSSGEATFEFDLPQFAGEVRVMAVAYKEKNFGSQEAHIKVSDPVVITTSMPRFLSPNDTLDLPVTLANTTATAGNLGATINLEGPLKLIGSNSQSIQVKGNSEARLLFKIYCEKQIGEAKVLVNVNGLGGNYKEEVNITLRPPASLQKHTGAGFVQVGKTESIHLSQPNFFPTSQTYSLVIGKSPMLEYGKQLSYLIQYPHGCTEQAVSAAFPQLYFSEIYGTMQKGMAANVNNNVLEAIQKIKQRQLYSGGLTLWDGGGEENWFATVYATHFLVEAQKAGFTVEQSLLNKLLDYLAYRLRTKEKINWFYNKNQQRQIAPQEVAYSLYVLALAGKPQASMMNFYKANSTQLTLDAKYVLAAAFALAGDKMKFRELLPNNFAGEISDKQTGGAWASPLRDEAMALNVLLEVEPANSQIPTMVKHVSDYLKQSENGYLSTQERIFSLLALGKFTKQNASTNAHVVIKAGGKVIGESNGETLKFTSKQLADGNLEITTTGTGKLYYYFETAGISKDGSFTQEDNFLKVRKTFYDRFGKVISGNHFKQNDLIIIGITLENSFARSIENIVITDMLPAGFEIENTRIREIAGMDWIKNETKAETTDFRDDRVNLFTQIGATPQHYYYAVRAVSKGTFVLGPVSADAMYAGEYHSYHGAGKIVVE